MIKNLGQVAAIYIGTVAPTNRNMIWLDNTVIPYVFRSYDGASWSELATRDWVKMFVNGWLVSLAPATETQKTDYLLINSGNVNYKIAVKDFVASAIGNPLDFKGVIKTSADFPNPSTLEPGDMYVIITTPPGGTVTDPYSGKTFEDSEKIVWDGVTIGWESLGKIKITVDLSTEYTANKVTINSTAGEGTDINAASETSAGVMNALMYVLLNKLSNGSIIPAEQPSDKSTPAHRHNYADIIGRVISQQEEGDSTFHPMSQDATTKALALKFDKASVLQVLGNATDKVISQKVVTDNLALKADITWVQTNYLPLTAGPTKPLSGTLYAPAGINIVNDVGLRFGTDASNSGYRTGMNSLDGSLIIGKDWDSIMIGTSGKVTRFLSNITVPYLNWSLLGTDGKAILSTGAAPGDITLGTGNADLYLKNANADLQHNKAGTNYKIWDASNLPNPATLTDLAEYIPLTGGKNIGPLWLKDGSSTLTKGGIYNAAGNALLAYNGTDNYFGTSLGSTYIRSIANDLIHRRGNVNYKIWDSYNLASPATTTDLGNYLPLSGGTMTGNIYLNNNIALVGKTTSGTNYNLVRIDTSNHVVVGTSGCITYIISNEDDLYHYRNSTQCRLWDSFNLRDPLPRSAGASNALTGNLYVTTPWSLRDLNDNGIIVTDNEGNQSFGRNIGATHIRSNDTDLYHVKAGTNYKIWDASNLPNVEYTWGFNGVNATAEIDLNTALNNGSSKPKAVYNYGSLALWKNAPTGMGYGSVFELWNSYIGNSNDNGTLMPQLAFDVNHNVAAGTRYMYFRVANNLGYGDSSNWKRVVTADEIGTITGNYLPLSGGTMTGNIIFNGASYALFGKYESTNVYLAGINPSGTVLFGDIARPTIIQSSASDLLHNKKGTNYKIWDESNLAQPADLNTTQTFTGTKTFNLIYAPRYTFPTTNVWTSTKTPSDYASMSIYLEDEYNGGGPTGYSTMLTLSGRSSHWVNQLRISNDGVIRYRVGNYTTDSTARTFSDWYTVWSNFNLPNPATTTDLNNYLPLTAGSAKPLTGPLYIDGTTSYTPLVVNLKTTTASWERSLNYMYNGTNLARFGAYGTAGTLNYAFIGVAETYNDTKNLRVYPSGSIQIGGVSNALLGYSCGAARISALNITKTANDVLHISSFIEGGSNYPGSDSISGQNINDGYALTYFWLSDVALQIAFDIDGTGVAYRSYKPSTGVSTTVWKFLANTAWVNTKINSAVGNYLPLSGGVITSTAATPLTINGTSSGGSEVGLLINRSGVRKAFFGYNSNLGAFMYSYTRSKYLYISDTADEVRLGVSGSDYALAKAVGIGTVGNNFIWNQNEFSFVPAGYNNRVWFNYRAIDGSALANPIQEYCFGAGTQGGYTRVVASGFKTPTGTNQNILRGDGSSSPLSEATTTTAGLMSPSDKTKVRDAVVSTGTNRVVGILVVDEIPSPSEQAEGVLYLKFE